MNIFEMIYLPYLTKDNKMTILRREISRIITKSLKFEEYSYKRIGTQLQTIRVYEAMYILNGMR